MCPGCIALCRYCAPLSGCLMCAILHCIRLSVFWYCHFNFHCYSAQAAGEQGEALALCRDLSLGLQPGASQEPPEYQEIPKDNSTYSQRGSKGVKLVANDGPRDPTRSKEIPKTPQEFPKPSKPGIPLQRDAKSETHIFCNNMICEGDLRGICEFQPSKPWIPLPRAAQTTKSTK